MHIPRVENTNLSISSLLLDPKVITLIEKLANQPLLIEKLVFNQSPYIQLKMRDNAVIQQINIPISLSKEISLIGSIANKINIYISNNQIVLNIIPEKPNALSSRSVDAEGRVDLHNIALYFKKAHILDKGVLDLSQNIKRSLPLINETRIIQTIKSSSPSLDIKPNLSFGINNEIPLKEAISHFLKNKPLEQPSVSASINKLIFNQNKLLMTINQPLKTLKTPSSDIDHTSEIITHKDKSNIASIKEFLSKLNSVLPEQKEVEKLNELFSKIDKLKNSIDFSENNKKLNLQQRINTNGIFLESKLEKFSIAKEKTISPDNQNISDLKTITFSIKTTLETLLLNLNENSKKPMYFSRLIQALMNKPTTTQLISTCSKNNEAQSVLNSLKAQLSNSLNISNRSNSDVMYKIQMILNKMLDEFKNIQLLPKENDSKQSNHPIGLGSLKEIIFDERLINLTKNLSLNQRQEAILLNNQKQIIRDMIKDTNSTISKIETNQLLSIKNESSSAQQFLLDLPIFHNKQIESFELLLESKEDKEKNKKSKAWTITVRFDLEPLGPMFARVSLKNERISTHFFAKNQDTANLLVNNIEHLKDSLIFAGLDIDEVSGQQGIVPTELLTNNELTIDVHA